MPEINPADMALQEALSSARRSDTTAAAPVRPTTRDQFKLQYERAQATYQARQQYYARLRQAAVYGDAHDPNIQGTREGLVGPHQLPKMFNIPLETEGGVLLGLHPDYISPEDQAELAREIQEAGNQRALKGTQAAPYPTEEQMGPSVGKTNQSRMQRWFQNEFGDDASLI